MKFLSAAKEQPEQTPGAAATDAEKPLGDALKDSAPLESQPVKAGESGEKVRPLTAPALMTPCALCLAPLESA